MFVKGLCIQVRFCDVSQTDVATSQAEKLWQTSRVPVHRKGGGRTKLLPKWVRIVQSKNRNLWKINIFIVGSDLLKFFKERTHKNIQLFLPFNQKTFHGVERLFCCYEEFRSLISSLRASQGAHKIPDRWERRRVLQLFKNIWGRSGEI